MDRPDSVAQHAESEEDPKPLNKPFNLWNFLVVVFGETSAIVFIY